MQTKTLVATTSALAAVLLGAFIAFPHAAQAQVGGFRLRLSASYRSFTTSPGFKVVQSDPFLEFNSMITGIGGGKGLSGCLGWQFQSGVGVFASAGYSYDSATDTAIMTDVTGRNLGNLEIEYRVSTVPLLMGADYRFHRGRFATVFDAAFQINYLEFSMRIDDYALLGLPGPKQELGEATALGGSLGIALEWLPVPQLSVGARAAYNAVEQERLWEYDVDLTGPAVAAYLEYRPWWVADVR